MAGGPLDDIFAAAGQTPRGPQAEALRDGLRALLMLAGRKAVAEHLSGALPDYLTALLDERISAQVNAILHHADFLALEAAWRGLRFLVDRLDFSQNIKLEYLNISKDDLVADFEDAPEVVKSGLYKHIYTDEFGQFGGQPVAAVIADYIFTPSARDIRLLKHVSSVASLAHAPFFAAAGEEFFDLDDWSRFADIKDLKSLFDMPGYARWNSFRETETARYIGLSLPGFLLRPSYDQETAGSAAFNFTEIPENERQFCWGNTAFALAVCLADSFAKYRWCVNIIGPDGGGALTSLPHCQYVAMRGIQNKIPTRTAISEHREYELAELGFIALVADRKPNEAVFFSANSALKPKLFPKTPEGAAAEINFRLSTQFPYMMLMNRIAHYIKVLQRESVGARRSREDIARELNAWISRYVTAMDTPDALTRSRRPLRMAHIDVKEIEGNSGWYAVSIQVRPHFKYMGANFTLSLEGRLEKEPLITTVSSASAT
ncbi:MAG: type VI secretion system contractile sheath large subunit [Deltaproteobacteria bacterium]|jgi:type VI secretion system protein ImpC|nr:type VI secretion system contractile sheath large subunit [Deltaproteobacteria bacterium]